jgi:hypothetical protein
MVSDNFKPTQFSEALAVEMVNIFGGQDAVPLEMKEVLWLIHMRLTEVERDIEYFRERLAEYTKTGAAVPDPAPTVTGAYAARLLLSEALALEVEVGSPFKVAMTLHEKVTFDPHVLVQPGVVEALNGAGAARLLLTNGDERSVRITRVADMWQGKLSISS